MHLPYEHVSLREGLRRGRSHLLFLAALAVVMAIIVALDGIAPLPQQRPTQQRPPQQRASPSATPGALRPDTPAAGTPAPAARAFPDSTAPASTPVLQ